MYRTVCVTAHPVLPIRLSKVNTSCGLALQIFIYQWELKAVGFSIYLCLTLELLWPPPRVPPWTACVHFPDSYPIDVSYPSFNFLCLLLLQCIYLNGCTLQLIQYSFNRVLQLTIETVTSATAAHNDCHKTGPCFHLCEGLNCRTHCSMGNTWITTTKWLMLWIF